MVDFEKWSAVLPSALFLKTALINPLVDKDKYFQQLYALEEIQISEKEMASDPDRHRSLSRHRRVSYIRKFSTAPQSGPYGHEFIHNNKSIFSHAGHAVMI
jgi:hypothetical protein